MIGVRGLYVIEVQEPIEEQEIKMEEPKEEIEIESVEHEESANA